MANSKISEEAQGALGAAEASDPEAHGYGPASPADALELLEAVADKVEAYFRSQRAERAVARVARRICGENSLTDEEAFRRAFVLAKRALGVVNA